MRKHDEEHDEHDDDATSDVEALMGAKSFAPNCARCWRPAPKGQWTSDGFVHADCDEVL